MKKTNSNKELWWVTRIYSGVLIAFSLAVFLGYRLFPEGGEYIPLEKSAVMQLSIMGVGLLALLLAWKWDLIGGIIALMCFVTIPIIEVNAREPILLIYPVGALLFILLWKTSRKRE